MLCGWHQIINSTFVINQDRTRHNEFCNLLGSMIMPLVMGSVFNYSLLALHHYLITFKKYVFDKLFTRMKTGILIAITWLLLIAFGVYFRLLVVHDDTSTWETRCYPNMCPKYVLVPSIVLLIFIFAIAYVNCRVYRRVRRLLKEITNDHPQQDQKIKTKMLRSVKSLRVVTTWLVVTYVCGCLMGPLSGLAPGHVGESIRDILFLVLLTNQANKPLVYLVTDGAYRASLKQMIRGLLICRYRKQKVDVVKSYDHNHHHSVPRRIVSYNPEHNCINEAKNPREEKQKSDQGHWK